MNLVHLPPLLFPPLPSPPVSDAHQFKNEFLFYRFRFDDGTFRHKQDVQDVHIRGLRGYLRLQGMYTPRIRCVRVCVV